MLATEPVLNPDLDLAPLRTWKKLGPLSFEEFKKIDPKHYHKQIEFQKENDDSLQYQEKVFPACHYHGQMGNYKKQGMGRQVSDGTGNALYEGQQLNNKFNGFGRNIYNNGGYYIGFWKDGFKHGQGKNFDEKGVLLFQGEYHYDKGVTYYA